MERKRFIPLFVGIFLLFSALFSALIAYADPPASPYRPGEILDPGCAPTDPNCTVNPPLFATTTLSQGSLLFIGDTSGTVSENNAGLFWDNTLGRLGIGTNAPSSTLQVLGGTAIVGNVTTTNLTIGGLGVGGETQCLHIDENGVVSGTGVDCGSGGSGIVHLATSTALNTFTTQVNGANATITIPSNLGFFTNDLGYLTTSTGLTPANFATTSVSQFANDAQYATSGAVALKADKTTSISAGGILTGGGDLSASRTISLSTNTLFNQFGVAGLLSYNTTTGIFGYTSSSLNLGSASQYAFSDFLSSSTAYVSTTTGNWKGTWQSYNPVDFLVSSTVYIANNLGNWAGTWQSKNSSDFLASSTAYVTTFNGATGTIVGVNSVNGATGTVTISSSSLGVVYNPNWLTTSTGLTTGNFATTSISQWNNNAGYLTLAPATTSINGFQVPSFLFVGANGLTIATSSTSTITFTAPAAASGTFTTVFGTNGVNVTALAGGYQTSSLDTAYVYNLFSAGGPGLTYNTSTGAFTYSSSSLDLGTASRYAFGDFLASSTAYVSTFNGATGTIVGVNSVNGATGTVVFGIPATTSVNGVNGPAFTLTSSTYLGITNVGGNFTFTNLGVTTTGGNWTGTWINATSGTYYPYSNPLSFISTSTGLTVANFATTSISQWNNNAGYLTLAPATTTLNGTQTSTFYLVGTAGQISSTVSGATTTFALASTSVTAGSCTYCGLTVDGYGRVTAQSSGSPVTSINGTAGAYTLYNGGILTIATGTASTTITLTTSTLYSEFAGSGPITFSTSTGAIGMTNPLPLANGGTATTSTPGTNQLMYFNGTAITGTSTAFLTLAPATTTINGTQSPTFYIVGSGNVTTTNAAGTTTIALTGVIPAANGGTGTTTALGAMAFVNSPVPIANGGTNTSTAPGTNQLMYYDGTAITGTSTAFLTTSTYNASITIATAGLLSGGASLTNGSTIALSFTGNNVSTSTANSWTALQTFTVGISSTMETITSSSITNPLRLIGHVHELDDHQPLWSHRHLHLLPVLNAGQLRDRFGDHGERRNRNVPILRLHDAPHVYHRDGDDRADQQPF